MKVTDRYELCLAGRDSERVLVPEALSLSRDESTCLPPLAHGEEGTVLYALDSIIHELLETCGQGVCSLNEGGQKRCKTPQGPLVLDLLALTRGQKTR